MHEIKVDPEAYITQLEQQLVAMNRTITLQGIVIVKLEKELGIEHGGNESSNGRSNEENAGLEGRSEQNGATVSG